MTQQFLFQILSEAQEACAKEVEMYERLIERVAVLEAGLRADERVVHRAIARHISNSRRFWEDLQKVSTMTHYQLENMLVLLGKICKDVEPALDSPAT